MNKTFQKIVGIGLAAMSLFSLAACGNDSGSSSGKEYSVGIVQFMDHPSLNQITENIEAELAAKETELGVKFNVSFYNGQADATTLNQIGSELVQKNVDIIVPIATPAAQVMQSVTEDVDIPIVFSAVSDPVSAGLVDDMSAPGGKITGTSDSLNTDSIMQLMFALDPDCDYVGLLYSKSEDASKVPIEEAKAFLDEKGVKYIEKTGSNADEIVSAADALVAEGVDAVFTPTDNTVQGVELAIYEKFANAGIAHYAGADSFALNGALVGYGVDYTVLGKATADMVVDILVNGANPAEMAVQTFDNGVATVNTDTADALGYDMDTIKSAFDGLCTEIVETTTSEEFE